MGKFIIMWKSTRVYINETWENFDVAKMSNRIQPRTQGLFGQRRQPNKPWEVGLNQSLLNFASYFFYILVIKDDYLSLHSRLIYKDNV